MTRPGQTGPSPISGSIALGIASNAALAVLVVQRDVPPGWMHIAAAVLCALGFTTFAGALHDLLDMRAPGRVGGARLSPAQGSLLSIAGLVASLFAARLLGGDAVDVTLVLATLTLFYNAVARFIPGIGVLVPGALAAGVMLIPDWLMPLAPAVWLVMTIVVLVTIGVYLLEDARPVLSRRAWAAVVIGWGLMSAVILMLRTMAGHQAPWVDLSPVALLWPIGAVVGLGVLLRAVVARGSSRHGMAQSLIRWTALWQPMLAAAWCAALGLWVAAMILSGIGVVCLVLVGGSRDLGLTGPAPTWR